MRPCTQRQADAGWTFARATVPELQGWVLVLTDEDGVTGLGYAHAIPAITTNGAGAEAALRFLQPLLVGREPEDLAAILDLAEGSLAGSRSAKAAVDMALHDLVARRAGLPLSALMGGHFRDRIPQSRILSIKAPVEMAASAAALTAKGYRTLKLKLAGDAALDARRVAEVRAAVGPEVTLTLDPNQSYSAKGFIAAWRALEPHGIALVEQPVPAADWKGLALVTRSLPVPVEADETVESVADVLRVVEGRVADVVNLKLTKLGGVRNFVTAARILEGGQVAARVGAAFGPALIQAAAAHAAASLRQLPFACELSEHDHILDDPFTPLPIEEGVIAVPPGPGCGVTYA
ncbi:mandelate racemase/muconate lactonizing enzyme family protein [Roseomonas sp. BN140053]|uniref:mandelate racemase/muconate lactonizing enzyme family protein n=1 Tax=Roseomonas sp. BN140053 TaxID=3391898 RepID=UPI0039EBD0A3